MEETLYRSSWPGWYSRIKPPFSGKERTIEAFDDNGKEGKIIQSRVVLKLAIHLKKTVYRQHTETRTATTHVEWNKG